MLAHRPAVTTDPSQSRRPPLAWEETACPLCGRDSAELLTEAADPIPADGPGLRFAVVECRHCRLAYTNPRPTAEAIARFYPPDYRPHQPPPAARRVHPPTRFWSRVLGRPCPERRGVLPGGAPGRLLDFGCGGGGYLRRMADLGWRVTGLDLAPRVVRAVRDDLGCDALAGSLPHPELAPASFDVVTMWQSLEHVHRPLAILREALRVLVPGGTAVVAVPNFDSLPARWYGEHWFGLDLPRHLTHFTPATLTEMLRVAGFRVKSVRGLVHADWLRSSARRALGAGVGGVASRLLSWKPVAKAVSWACYALGRAETVVAVAERPA
jgi:2-polyprenyl-3-methyl-5-hydroxy-6-metoxy-1,4-benzoquinol methylase